MERMTTNEDKEGLRGKHGLSDGYIEYKKEYIDFLRGRRKKHGWIAQGEEEAKKDGRCSGKEKRMDG